MKKFIIKITSLIFWIAIWQILYNWVDAKFLIASPFDVGINIYSLLLKPETWSLIVHTTLRIMIGFIFASCVGILLGTISYVLCFLKELIDVLISIIKIAPIVSFIIFALVYMETVFVVPFISFLMVLPIFYYATYESLTNIDKKMIEMANMYEYSFLSKVKYIYLNESKKNLGLSHKELLLGSLQISLVKLTLGTQELTLTVILIRHHCWPPKLQEALSPDSVIQQRAAYSWLCFIQPGDPHHLCLSPSKAGYAEAAEL